ncbi:MAG: RNase adapter RapZ [Actinobacteria bacterium]|nr:MAG: RNase adapter RapZ [Actinomycetota bacterium]
MADILLIAGLSGAGRSQAADDLEDIGWFVVDNMPIALIDKVVELAATGEQSQLALVVGTATHQTDAVLIVHKLRDAGHRVRILFLDASTPELVRRYGASRRKHPLANQFASVEDAIHAERVLLETVKGAADLVIDTSSLNIHQLKSQIVELFAPTDDRDVMQLSVVSFGFKHGIPTDVDLVLDVRFLPNPHWDEDLRPQSGLDEAVKNYVVDQPLAQEFLQKIYDLLQFLVPAYQAEGKSYLTVAIGCTGGRHRSVAVTEAIGAWMTAQGQRPRLTHRDIFR